MIRFLQKLAQPIAQAKPEDLRKLADWLHEGKHLIVAIAAFISFGAIATLIIVREIQELIRELAH